MKITSILGINYLKKNKKRSTSSIIGIVLAVCLISTTLIILSSYQKYVLDIKRYDRNWEAEFKNISYKNALEIAKDENIKEISIIRNIGNSKENFSSNNDIAGSIGSLININISEFDENAIKNNAHFIQGRAPTSPSEIALSTNLDGLIKDKFELGQTLSLTINEGTKTYTIVGLVDSLPTDVAGFAYNYIVGGITYFDSSKVSEDAIVDVSILTHDIKRIYETTENLANRLALYETEEEKNSNLKYYEILLNYSFVNGDNKREKSYFEFGEAESRKYGADVAKIVGVVLTTTRHLLNSRHLYIF